MVRDTSDLTRFVESASIDHRLIQNASEHELKESMSHMEKKLVESISDDTSKGWWVPISHFGNYKNGNGRIYNTKLWENVINNQREVWCGSPMLTDHPAGDSDGNPRDICGVWIDAKFGPAGPDGVGIVYGLLVPSGHNGQDLRDHLQNGLRIGTSSSGFGKLMRDGMTVDPDTFQIERLADWVLNPSQGTFFSYDESSDDILDKTIRESNEFNVESAAEMLQDAADVGLYDANGDYVDNVMSAADRFDFTDSQKGEIRDYLTELYSEKKNNKENKVVKDSKITKLEEKKFRRDMESFLEDANNLKDPQERLKEFKEIRSYLDEGICSDLKEKVEQKIAEEEAYIKKALKEQAELHDELGIESTKDLKEKLTKIVQDQKLVEKEAGDWKKVSEKLQSKLMEANKELKERATVEYTEFQKNKIESLTEQMKEHDGKSVEVLKSLSEAYKKLKEENEELEAQVADLEEKNANLQKQLESTQMKLELANNEHENLYKNYAKVCQESKKAKEVIGKYKTLVENQRVKVESVLKKMDDLKAMNESKTKTISSLSKEAKESQIKLKEAAIKELREQRADLSDTEAYYEELYQKYGNEVVPFKEKIANAPSMRDAQNVFLFKVLPELNESRNIDRTRIPETLYTSPEERAKAINGKAFYKESVIDRKPKTWR